VFGGWAALGTTGQVATALQAGRDLFAAAATIGYSVGNAMAVVMNFPQIFTSLRTGKTANISAKGVAIGMGITAHINGTRRAQRTIRFHFQESLVVI
jgi:hypothetical protein